MHRKNQRRKVSMRSMALFCLLIVATQIVSGLVLADSAPAIVIDVGHSKLAYGAVSARGEQEFEFNAALVKVVQGELTAHGALIRMIGADGQMKDLKKRSEQANMSGAAFFLSIHHDSVQPKYLMNWQWQGKSLHYCDKFSGYSLFVSRSNPYFDASLRCGSAIGAALRHQGFHPSAHHAENIPGENREWADKENGVYYYDGLAVLRNARSPAVLLEAGVILNRIEELQIQEPQTRAALATAIEQGLAACGIMNNKNQ